MKLRLACSQPRDKPQAVICPKSEGCCPSGLSGSDFSVKKTLCNFALFSTTFLLGTPVSCYKNVSFYKGVGATSQEQLVANTWLLLRSLLLSHPEESTALRGLLP